MSENTYATTVAINDRMNAASLLEIAEKMRSVPKPEEIVWLVPRGFMDSIPRFTEIERTALGGVCPQGIPVVESQYVDRPKPVPRWVVERPILNLQFDTVKHD